MTINVLHIVLSLGTGGLENGVVNTINGSNPKRFKIDVLCLRELGELGDRITNSNTQIFFDAKLSSGLSNSIKAILKALKENEYDIIHTHGWATMLAGYLACFFKTKPMVINGEHGTLYYKSLQQRLIQWFLFNRMKINLSVSAALVKEISRKFGVDKKIFKPILNGVNTQKFSPNKNSRNKIRQELGISDDTLVVGSVGRLVTVKNYPSLLESFKLISEKVPNSKLLFAGDGPNRDSLEQLAKKLNIEDKVLFLGRREDVPEVMNSYDVFVLPSFREGLSNTILEAMSTGLPAVVSDVGGSPEIVIEEQTGHLFKVGDINQMSSLIVNLLEKPQYLEKLSKNARQHVVYNYSLETMVENYQNVYQALVTEKQRN